MEMIERLVITYAANSLWMTCLIVAAATLLTKVIRQCPSKYRHVLWVLALAFSSLLPLASLRNTLSIHDDVASRSIDTADMKAIPVADGISSPGLFAFKKSLHKRAVSFAPLLADLATAVYSVFVIYRGLFLVWAWRRIRIVLRDARYRALSPRHAEIVAGCCSALHLDRISIAFSQAFGGPVVVGVWRPRLILPEWFRSGASEEQLVTAVSHELAHVRRRDFVLNLVYEILFLPISFHPAARAIKSQIERSRELACDEMAAGNLPTRAVYARSLVSIAQTIAAMAPSGRTRYALGLMSPDTLEERIVNLLKKTDQPDKTRRRARVVVASGLLTAACLIASSFSIQVARARNTSAEIERFTGTWEGKFKGKTFVTLKLVARGGKIVGSVSRVSIEMGPTGILTDASSLVGEDAFSEAAPQGKVLHLSTKAMGHVSTRAGDSDESIQYDIKLIGTNQAELQITVVPAGMPVPAPWKLERKSTAP